MNKDIEKFTIAGFLICLFIGLFIGWGVGQGLAQNQEQQKVENITKVEQRWGGVESEFDYDIIFDKASGVYYAIIKMDNDIAMTPLYNVDGLPLCVDDINHGDINMALQDVKSNLKRLEE